MRIIPSIVSVPRLDSKYQLDRIKDVLYVHTDAEDRNFLPNVTFGMKTVKEVTAYSKAGLDAHLLAISPIECIHELSENGISAVYGHMEALPYPLEFLHEMCRTGMKTGLTLGLSMPTEQIDSYIGPFDYLLLMASEPDSCGQRFRPCVLERVRGVRAYIPGEVMIYADGGVGKDELGKAEKIGVGCMIMGRAVWGAEDPAKA